MITYDPVIKKAWIDSPPTHVTSEGDLWMSAWADDDKLYVTWGDGLGPGVAAGEPYPRHLYTDCGCAVLLGDPPSFTNTDSPESCVHARNAPTNSPTWKPEASRKLLWSLGKPEAKEGFVRDKSGLGHDGTIIGTECKGTGGRREEGCEFDGVGDYIICENFDTSLITDALTLTVGVKRRFSKPGNYIFSSGFGLCQIYGGYKGWIATDNGIFEIISDTGYENDLGNWTHIALIYNGEKLTLLRNFEPVESVQASGRLLFTNKTIFAGRTMDSKSDFFHGTLDEVGVYNEALKPAQIRAHYDDKPSSIIAIDGRLYMAGHTPLGVPDYGYIAYSDDRGSTWTEASGSPWTAVSESVFRCLLFLQMGRNYSLNSDGYVYSYGIGTEWDWRSRTVYLARVPKQSIADYSAYTYLVEVDSQNDPVWSSDQSSAQPLDGLHTWQMGSAMFHEGIGRYIFLAIEGLYEAPEPWGPWVKVADLFRSGDDPVWNGGYMPGLIAKGAGPDWVYFTLAGQDDVIKYHMHIGKLRFARNGSTS